MRAFRTWHERAGTRHYRDVIVHLNQLSFEMNKKTANSVGEHCVDSCAFFRKTGKVNSARGDNVIADFIYNLCTRCFLGTFMFVGLYKKVLYNNV